MDTHQLYYSPFSPFSRLCRITWRLRECKLIQEIEVDPMGETTPLIQVNPLMTAPTLVTASKEHLCDSGIILRYLDQFGSKAPCFHYTDLRGLERESLAQGLIEALVRLRQEQTFIGHAPSIAWMNRLRKKINSTLAILESSVSSMPVDPQRGDGIKIITALDYLAFRHAVIWKDLPHLKNLKLVMETSLTHKAYFDTHPEQQP